MPLKNMFYVYVLESNKDKKLYIGYTRDLKRRFEQQLNGQVKSTKNRLPVQLIYYEAYRDNRDATKREYFLKRGRGRELLKALLKFSLFS